MIIRPLFLLPVVLMTGCATTSTTRQPAFTLAISAAFNHSVGLKRIKIGDDLWAPPPTPDKAKYPITKYAGAWGKQNFVDRQEHSWKIEVSLAPTARIQQIQKACSEATDGYDAGHRVDEDGSYMFARFAHKDFRWGRAFSYLTQFTQDTSVYVPHNGHLTYEVWGITQNGSHVVHATFDLTHPKLGTWGPEVRVADSIEALKRDRDYALIESCSSSAFAPGLTEIDSLLNSLEVE